MHRNLPGLPHRPYCDTCCTCDLRLFLSLSACFAELKHQLLSRRLVNSSDILGGAHCLAPACIRASLASSLAKLRIDTLDLLYLHNAAEVQLEARGKQGFFEVLRVAFKVRV